jgi:hypothetical protein
MTSSSLKDAAAGAAVVDAIDVSLLEEEEPQAVNVIAETADTATKKRFIGGPFRF